MAGLLGSTIEGAESLWDKIFYGYGQTAGKLNQLPMSTGQVYNAYKASGMNPSQALVESGKFAMGTGYGDYQPTSQVQMAQPQSQAYVNPEATKQVAQGIGQPYSLLGQSKLPASGSMWEQIGGFFNDRPALTEGLLTTGIGLGAGLGGQAFAVGGQAMANRQGAIANAEEKQYARNIEAQKFELDTLKTNADILKAINEGGGSGSSYKAALDEAVKSGLEGAEAQRYAMFKQAGITPPLATKGRGLIGLGVLGGPLGWGKQYTVVNK